MAEDTSRHLDPRHGSSSTLVGSASPNLSLQSSPTRKRPPYQRLGSSQTPEGTPHTIHEHSEGEDIADTVRRGSGPGLGIDSVASPRAGHARRVSIQTYAKVPPGAKASPQIGGTPGSSDPLISPPLWGTSSHLSDTPTAYDPTAQYGDSDATTRRAERSASSLNVDSFNQYNYGDTEPLNKRKSYAANSIRSTKSAYQDNDFEPHACPTDLPFYSGRWDWLALTVLVLALFSTVFSGIFMGIALAAPRWGKQVRTGGSLSPSSADILTQVFAKLIELSFVTAFVTFLGQVLSRRAFSRHSRGVTLAEITMRNWIMQPQFAALSILGVLSLVVALLAMLYTVAAVALVAPQLKFGSWEPRLLYGVVRTSFANVNYLSKNCQTPIQRSTWMAGYKEAEVGSNCLELDHVSQGFHNYNRYMAYWAVQVETGNASTVDQRFRPQGFGLFNENITVNGSWIHTIDTKKVSEDFGRAINNVTLAMPHSGVVQAGWDPKNNIMQPSELDGMGIYNIRAAVPSPYVNVLCANAAGADIAPLVYANQTNVRLNATQDFAELSTHWYTVSMNWTEFNSAKPNPLDEVFGWTKPSDRPAFYKLPIQYNTILNNTRPEYFRDSLYLLGKGDAADDYLICKIKAGTTPICATEYSATGNNGNLKAKCDPEDPMAFNKRNTSRVETTSFDWYDVGQTALTAMSLNSGVTDGAAANARLLTQLMLKDKALNPALPSPAEALAVMIGCTLLMSADGSPFVEFWNYTVPTLLPGEHQSFDAVFQGQEYASGGVMPYQKAFHIVLITVFLLNLFVLVYLIRNKGLVTDFSEPPNLFSLAVNSPPSTLLAGSCGGGPHGRQYEVNWAIETEGEHLYMTNRKDGEGNVTTTGYSPVHVTGDGARDTDEMELGHIPRTTTGSAPVTPMTPGSASRISRHGSKFGRAYSMLSKRKSLL
ncbi:hypothetical protein FKW77_001325 [Venturia effusa]|uniref:Uncharacterized protein n=1 Tax=Venturia effusa TaxID=50376 RepID=A0A517LD69_9PEZI|nr:hypothetical protein FKW77_001325 [Venturia effusa]